MLGHDSSLSKFKKTETCIKRLFQQHYEIRNQLQEKNYIKKKHKHMEATNNQEITEEIKQEI